VKPFLGEVPKSWLANEPSSEVIELPERADDKQTLVKEPNDEPNSDQMYVQSADNKLTGEPEPEEESVLSNIDYEVDST